VPQSPWQNPYIERLNSSIRHECLDRKIVAGETHLRSIPKSYTRYYNEARTHLALERTLLWVYPLKLSDLSYQCPSWTASTTITSG